MRKIRLTLVLFLSLAVVPGLCLGATYYVDANNGNDSNPGTSDAPWQTIGRAYTWYDGEGSKVVEGDTVLFRDGNYGDYLETTGAGGGPARLVYRTDWITYKADTGHIPTLNSIDAENKDKWGGRGDGSLYLIFDGFKIPEAVSISYASYVQVRNCNITGLASSVVSPWEGPYAPYIYYGSGVRIVGAHYVTVENNDISYARTGIELGNAVNTDNISIIGNTIYRMAEDGIKALCNDLLIESNTIYDIWTGRTIENIWGTVTGDFIEGEIAVQPGTGERAVVDTPPAGLGNTIDLKVMQLTPNRFTADGGAIIGQTSGATVTNITKVDGAHTDAIQMHGQNADGVIVRANILLREKGAQALKISTAGTGAGSGIDNIVIENNLIWASKPIMGRKGDDVEGPMNVIKMNNNTFFGLGSWGEGSGVVNSDLVVTNMYNNIFGCLQVLSAVANHGNNIFMYDPISFNENSTEVVKYEVEELFVNPLNGDFLLKEGALAIDFGDSSFGPDTDITGGYRDNKPDAGCYEYGASGVRPEPEADGNVAVERTSLSVFNNIIKSGGNSVVTINCDIKEAGNLSVKIYDSKGREVVILFDGHKEAGSHSFPWVGVSSGGSKVGSGIYMVQMRAGSYDKVKKIAVIK